MFITIRVYVPGKSLVIRERFLLANNQASPESAFANLTTDPEGQFLLDGESSRDQRHCRSALSKLNVAGLRRASLLSVTSMKQTFDKAYPINHEQPESQTEQPRHAAHGEICPSETVRRQTHRQADERAHHHHPGD